MGSLAMRVAAVAQEANRSVGLREARLDCARVLAAGAFELLDVSLLGKVHLLLFLAPALDLEHVLLLAADCLEDSLDASLESCHVVGVVDKLLSYLVEGRDSRQSCVS